MIKYFMRNPSIDAAQSKARKIAEVLGYELSMWEVISYPGEDFTIKAYASDIDNLLVFTITIDQSPLSVNRGDIDLRVSM